MINIYSPTVKDGTTPVVIRPTPFVSIGATPIRNSIGTLGSIYDITLTGTILPDEGSPFKDGTFADDDTRPDTDTIPSGTFHQSVFRKQNALRELFATDGVKIEILATDGSDTPNVVLYAKMQNISFEPGTYTDLCRYTINLTTNYIQNVDGDGVIWADGRMLNIESDESKTGADRFYDTTAYTPDTLRAKFGGFVSDFQESWSLEVDESLNETSGVFGITPKGYVITRNTSATGRTDFRFDATDDQEKHEAWDEAKKFLDKSVLTDLPTKYPGYAGTNGDGTGGFASLTLGLISDFNGCNHSRTESIDKTNGVVSVTDTWFMCKDIAFESYDASISSESAGPFVSVNINGTIAGVTSMPADAIRFGGQASSSVASKIENALAKWNNVSGSGTYDFNSAIYKRANALIAPQLNPQPLSISLSRNDFAGELSYAVSYDNRPLNVVTEATSENIQINDTYPGDLYAVIPVIGRVAGPVLQYIGGRTEYRRDVSLELIFDYTDIDYATSGDIGALRKSLMLSKPSLQEPARTQINNFLQSVSPLGEPGIRKCFLNPPTENWTPKEGRYNINLSWVYELDK